jgi:hypothetical protein
VKPSDYPEQDGRTVPFQSEDKESVLARRVPEPETRYLDVPRTPDQLRATRNLTWAIVSLVLAALAFWLGLHYAGAAAARTLVACLATFGIVLLLSNFQVLRQRYGVLLGLGLTVLLGAAIPFIEGGFRRLDGLARERLGGETESVAGLTVPPPPPTIATAPPAPPTIPLPASMDPGSATLDGAPGEGKPAIAAAAKKAPLATKPASDDPTARELIVPPPPAGAGKLIRVKEDVKVNLDGRPTIIRAGTIAPFKALSDGQVTFLAGDHEVSIDMGLVVFTGASKEKPEDITKLAHQEVMRRYPKVGVADSKENILFVTRVKEFELNPEMKAVFFQDPKWPLVMAEQLATQEGWRRADLAPEETEEAPIPDNQKPAQSESEKPGALEKESLLPDPSPVPEQASEPPPAR